MIRKPAGKTRLVGAPSTGPGWGGGHASKRLFSRMFVPLHLHFGRCCSRSKGSISPNTCCYSVVNPGYCCTICCPLCSLYSIQYSSYSCFGLIYAASLLILR